ncbi:MAG: LysM peptidoglycan-binding domain-containing protein [Luteolibacter sp.]
MRFSRQLSLLTLLVLPFLLPSCGNHGGAGGGTVSGNPTGPYDKNGNYVEAWADKPSLWGKSRRSTPANSDTDTPTIAANEQPPDSAVPLVAGGSTTVGNYKPSQKPSRNEVEVSSRSKVREREASATKSSSSRETASSKTKSKTPDKSTASSSKTKSKTTEKSSTASSSKSKGKETASSTKSKSSSSGSASKPKTTSSRYTVKKGDSLSSIASRNKTSVSALQRANGIKGTTIQPGKTLVIPK